MYNGFSEFTLVAFSGIFYQRYILIVFMILLTKKTDFKRFTNPETTSYKPFRLFYDFSKHLYGYQSLLWTHTHVLFRVENNIRVKLS